MIIGNLTQHLCKAWQEFVKFASYSGSNSAQYTFSESPSIKIQLSHKCVYVKNHAFRLKFFKKSISCVRPDFKILRGQNNNQHFREPDIIFDVLHSKVQRLQLFVKLATKANTRICMHVTITLQCWVQVVSPLLLDRYFTFYLYHSLLWIVWLCTLWRYGRCMSLGHQQFYPISLLSKLVDSIKMTLASNNLDRFLTYRHTNIL